MAKKSKKNKKSEEPEEDVIAPKEEETKAEDPKPEEKKSEPEPLETRILRLQADFDNYRKRMVRERQEWTQRAAENLMEDLLPVMDHYEMGLGMAEKSDTEKAVLDGFQLVYSQLNSMLKKYGVEPIATADGVFDPHMHEAITHFPSPDHEADVVISQTRKGYKIGEKLLRPAQVVVSSGPPVPEEPKEEEAEPSGEEN